VSDALPEPHLIEVELRIITWLPTRLSFADVGERVGLPAEAVKETVIALYRKLGVVNREEAVLRCVDLNLLSSAMASQSTEAITLPDTTDLQSSLEDLDEPFMQMRAVRDRDGRIVDFEYQYCNRAVLDALGRRREEMIGRCLLELYPAVATHWLFEAFVTVTNDGEARRYEFPFNEYGVVGDFEITLSRHGDGLVLVGHDISVRKRQERDLVLVRDQLQSALTSRVVIEQAKGFAAARADIDPDKAFLALRRHARNHNLKLTDVAQAVIDGTLDLHDPRI